MSASIRYLVFDIESIADAPLVAKLRYPGQSLTPAEAVRRYRAELMEKFESDFIPYTFQIPISVVVGKVAADFRLIDVVVLDDPQFRPHVITGNFWRGWELYQRPTLVSFNGRGFDLPLLELSAFRFGLSLPGWFQSTGKPAEQSRNRYNTTAHIDLCELLTNFGSSRFNGGLNLAANLIGKPGKMDVQGNMVQDLYDLGRLAEINDYCRCDVLDTYFVFLRSRVLIGQLSIDAEQAIVAEVKAWLEGKAAQVPGYQQYVESRVSRVEHNISKGGGTVEAPAAVPWHWQYLDCWGDWPNPWK